MNTMEKSIEIEVAGSVKEFTALWNESLENRYEAAQIYYECVTEHPDSDVKEKFFAAFPNWTALRWRWIYYVGAGKIAKPMLDVHNYSLALAMAVIPISAQEAIVKSGLKLYCKEHPGGIVIPLKRLNRRMLGHVYDLKTGEVKSVALQRKTPLSERPEKAAIIWTHDKDGRLAAKVIRSLLLDRKMLEGILTFKNAEGESIFSPADLRNIANKLGGIA